NRSVIRLADRPAALVEFTHTEDGERRRILMLLFVADRQVVAFIGGTSTTQANVAELDRKYNEARALFLASFQGATVNNPVSYSSDWLSSKGAIKLIAGIVIFVLTSVEVGSANR